MLGEAHASIFDRKVRLPLGNSPFFMRVNKSRLSSTERFRNGLSVPGLSGAPRYRDPVSSGERSQT